MGEWIVQINNWLGGLLFPGIIIGLGFTLYGIMKQNGVTNLDALLASNFTCFLISLVGFLIQFQQEPLINLAIVIMFLIFFVITIVVKALKDNF
jgi:hypothetical protein